MENTDIVKNLVSIIIPVYNTEKYLGYCLNSVVSQTYCQIEIILVNDGSTDNSLTICQNYAKIDDRISIITIGNGGVSKARNVGLDAAKGEFVQFVDSDDVIRSNMVECLIQLMEMYQVDLAVCGFKKIKLSEDIGRAETVTLSTGIMGRECVLTRELLLGKMGHILWKTSTLESMTNKMFRRTIIEDNHIRFLTDLSLGEDFCFNMDCIQYINGVVFTSEAYYYYLQENKNALTRKYRSDLFDNQMFLIERFCNLIKEFVKISREEEREIAEYTIAKMMQSLYNLTSGECSLSIFEKKREIARIINNDFVRKAYGKAEYIEPKYEWIREYIEFSDIQSIYERLLSVKMQRPTILKKVLIKMCDAILRVHYIKFIEMIRESLKIRSIKKTIIKCFLKLIGKSKGYDEVRAL